MEDHLYVKMEVCSSSLELSAGVLIVLDLDIMAYTSKLANILTGLRRILRLK